MTHSECAVLTEPQHEAAGADVKPAAIGRAGDIRGKKRKKAETQFDPGGAASGTELLKGSEVERAFLWMVNPPLNRAAGRAQMSAFTAGVSVSLLRRLTLPSLFPQKWDGLGLFPSESLPPGCRRRYDTKG